MRAFQQARGLHDTGRCDRSTWAALVEASWCLGDRHLYERRPMLRGDDVSKLQHHLGQLGFDPGRVDGIFGPDTERAVREFQRNAGLRVDGVFGHDTCRALDHLCRHRAPGVSVATVRERERHLDRTGVLQGRRFALGTYGPLSSLMRDLCIVLSHAGAETLSLQDTEQSSQAAAANSFGADAYIGLTLDDEPIVSYYSVPGFESLGGRRLADLVCESFRGSMAVRGMRLPILRETRMPAVLIGLHALGESRFPVVGELLAEAVRRWTQPQAI